MLQNATLWGNQRSDLLTSLLTMSLVLRLPRKMPLCRSSSNAPCLPTLLKLLQNPDAFCSLLTRCRIPCACHAKRYLSVQKWSEHVALLTFWLGNVLAPQWRALFQHLNFQKSSQTFFTLLTSTCASRHNSVHFFIISTSKSAPRMVCFVRFDFDMCFAPQRRASFYLSSGQMAPHPSL